MYTISVLSNNKQNIYINILIFFTTFKSSICISHRLVFIMTVKVHDRTMMSMDPF